MTLHVLKLVLVLAQQQSQLPNRLDHVEADKAQALDLWTGWHSHLSGIT